MCLLFSRLLRSRIKIYFCTQVRWLFRIILASCVQSISKWWSLDTVFVFFRCKCGNCIVASLQNIGERYCYSNLDFAVSYSSRSEGHNNHILWWYFELQMDRIHVYHLRWWFGQWFLLYFGLNSTCFGNSFRCFTLTNLGHFRLHWCWWCFHSLQKILLV